MGWNLVADIGGTNMRVAAAVDGNLSGQTTHPTLGELSVQDALAAFTNSLGSPPDQAVVAAAGIVEDGVVTLTNTGTRISEEDINSACGIKTAKILNDFEAAAWSLADIAQGDITCLQGSPALVRGPRVIVGPGTGLGVGALVWRGDDPVVVQGEGGHVRLSPDTMEELEIFKALVSDWPSVRMGDGFAIEAEAVVSGTGLPYFYQAIAKVHAREVEKFQAAEIFSAAREGEDKIAARSIEYFTKYLGEVAGDMGVIFAACGGVFIAGGVVAANPWIFDSPLFLDAFNSGGRHSEFRKRLPVYLYTCGQFGLNGALNHIKYTH